jgi:hypothetical protein
MVFERRALLEGAESSSRFDFEAECNSKPISARYKPGRYWFAEFSKSPNSNRRTIAIESQRRNGIKSSE